MPVLGYWVSTDTLQYWVVSGIMRKNYFQSRSRRCTNNTIEAAVTIALAQSIGSMRIRCCAKDLWFESSCMQTFCEFFLFTCNVVINVFL